MTQAALPSEPLVSIVMPVFNGRTTFERAIDSILSQTYKRTEVIVCDNASFDGTHLIIERKLWDQRVRHIRHPDNIGAVANFLYGISATRGDYILIAGDDDYWEASYIEKMLALMDPKRGIGIAQAGIARTTTAGQIVNICQLMDHTAHLRDVDQRTLSSARARLRHLLFSERCSDDYNPCNMLVLSLVHGPTMREFARTYPTDLIHDRAFMAGIVVKVGWRFTKEVLMTKVSVHNKPYSERRAPKLGEAETLTRDKSKYTNRKKILITLNQLLKSNLNFSEIVFVVLPQYLYFLKSELLGQIRKTHVN